MCSAEVSLAEGAPERQKRVLLAVLALHLSFNFPQTNKLLREPITLLQISPAKKRNKLYRRSTLIFDDGSRGCGARINAQTHTQTHARVWRKP